MSAFKSQVGGDHYSQMPIQPMEYSMKNGLNACQHTAIKYITRYKFKNGAEDIDKAIHTLELLKELEYGNAVPDPVQCGPVFNNLEQAPNTERDLSRSLEIGRRLSRG